MASVIADKTVDRLRALQSLATMERNHAATVTHLRATLGGNHKRTIDAEARLTTSRVALARFETQFPEIVQMHEANPVMRCPNDGCRALSRLGDLPTWRVGAQDASDAGGYVCPVCGVQALDEDWSVA